MSKRCIIMGLVMIAVQGLSATGCGNNGSDEDTTTESDTTTETDTGHTPAVCETVLPVLDDILAELDGLAFDGFIEEANKQIMLRFPENVTSTGLTATYGIRDDTLNDISDGFRLQTYALYGEILTRLQTFDVSELSADQAVTYRTFEWYLDNLVRDEAFMYHHFAFTTMAASPQNHLFLFFEDIHPVETRDNVIDYIERLRQIPTKLACQRQQVELSQQAGILPTQIMFDSVIGSLAGIGPGSGEYLSFYTTLAEKIAGVEELSAAEQEAYLEEALTVVENDVVTAYQDFVALLIALQPAAPPDDGVWQFPDGDAYYAHTLRHHTSTEMTPDEVHQTGLDEVARIQAEMQDLFESMGYPEGQTMAQYIAWVTEDGGIIEQALVLETYESIIAQAEQDLLVAFDVTPETPVIVIGGSYGGFYVPGSLDGSRPGAFYAYTEGSLPWYDMPSLTYHETIPGHHFQISIAMEQGLPIFQVRGFTAFIEGWALYAERLAKDLGWYEDDPYADVGRLQYELLRAVRLVVDTGIHSKQWSFEQCTEYMVTELGYPQAQAVSNMRRYLSWPSQATAYKIGMLKFLELRTKAETELAENYDIKEFHNAALLSGCVPLEVLEDIIDGYIANKSPWEGSGRYRL